MSFESLIQNPLEKLSENMPGLSIKAIWKEEKKEERVNKSRFVEKERERWWMEEITIGSLYFFPLVMSWFGMVC